MATEQSAFNIDLTLKAAADLSAYQYRYVKLSAADTVAICSNVADVPIGVLQNNPSAADQAAIVRTFGISKGSADEALTAGWRVGTSGDGQVDRKLVTDTLQYVVGQVLVGTTGANGLAEITVDCLAPRRAG